MSGQSVSASLRAAVERRANGRCEYCLVPDGAAMWPHEPDHVIAEQHGGRTDLGDDRQPADSCAVHRAAWI